MIIVQSFVVVRITTVVLYVLSLFLAAVLIRYVKTKHFLLDKIDLDMMCTFCLQNSRCMYTLFTKNSVYRTFYFRGPLETLASLSCRIEHS